MRWFFKEALNDLLPEKIINKSKHVIGLPFGVWSNPYAPLGDLAGEACLASSSAAGSNRRTRITCWRCSAARMPVTTG